MIPDNVRELYANIYCLQLLLVRSKAVDATFLLFLTCDVTAKCIVEMPGLKLALRTTSPTKWFDTKPKTLVSSLLLSSFLIVLPHFLHGQEMRALFPYP
jgi:hypothetical protein